MSARISRIAILGSLAGLAALGTPVVAAAAPASAAVPPAPAGELALVPPQGMAPIQPITMKWLSTTTTGPAEVAVTTRYSQQSAYEIERLMNYEETHPGTFTFKITDTISGVTSVLFTLEDAMIASWSVSGISATSENAETETANIYARKVVRN
jgi:hypothetical protein